MFPFCHKDPYMECYYHIVGRLWILRSIQCICEVTCSSPTLLMLIRTYIYKGAHNDVRVEGKGRSVQRSRKRVKFENIPTVVALLFLVHTCTASLTDYTTVAKVVRRHRIVISKCQKICFPAVINFRKPKWKVLSVSGNTPEVSLLRLWGSWINCVVAQHFSRSVTVSFLCFTTNGVLVVVFSFSSFVESPHTCLYTFAYKLKIVMGLYTARMFSNFYLLHDCCTLLPFPSALMSLCTPDILHDIH